MVVPWLWMAVLQVLAAEHGCQIYLRCACVHRRFMGRAAVVVESRLRDCEQRV
jgi:hypothetical protein